MKSHTVVKNAVEAGYFNGSRHADDLVERAKNLLGKDDLAGLYVSSASCISWVEDDVEIQMLIGYSARIYINMYALLQWERTLMDTNGH